MKCFIVVILFVVIALDTSPIFGQGTENISFEVSGGIGALFWTQNYNQLISSFDPINGSRQFSDDNKYSSISPVFSANIKMPIRFRRLSIGPSYGLSIVTIDKLKGEKYQYSSAGTYKLKSKAIHTSGVSMEITKLKIGGKEYTPIFGFGFSWHKGEAQYTLSSNYFTSLGLKLRLNNEGRVKTYIVPKATFIHYKRKYEGPFTSGGVDGSSDWAIKTRKNNLFILGVSYAIDF